MPRPVILRHVNGIKRNLTGDWTTDQIGSDYSPQMNKEFYDYLRTLKNNELPMPRKELDGYLDDHK